MPAINNTSNDIPLSIAAGDELCDLHRPVRDHLAQLPLRFIQAIRAGVHGE